MKLKNKNILFHGSIIGQLIKNLKKDYSNQTFCFYFFKFHGLNQVQSIYILFSIFCILEKFFLYSISLCFHVLEDFYIFYEHIDIFWCLFFRKMFLLFTNIFSLFVFIIFRKILIPFTSPFLESFFVSFFCKWFLS